MLRYSAFAQQTLSTIWKQKSWHTQSCASWVQVCTKLTIVGTRGYRHTSLNKDSNVLPRAVYHWTPICPHSEAEEGPTTTLISHRGREPEVCVHVSKVQIKMSNGGCRLCLFVCWLWMRANQTTRSSYSVCGREASSNVRLQASQETTASRHFNNLNRQNSITQAQTCPGMHNIPSSLSYSLFVSLPSLWLSIFHSHPFFPSLKCPLSSSCSPLTPIPCYRLTPSVTRNGLKLPCKQHQQMHFSSPFFKSIILSLWDAIWICEAEREIQVPVCHYPLWLLMRLVMLIESACLAVCVRAHSLSYTQLLFKQTHTEALLFTLVTQVFSVSELSLGSKVVGQCVSVCVFRWGHSTVQYPLVVWACSLKVRLHKID